MAKNQYDTYELRMSKDVTRVFARRICDCLHQYSQDGRYQTCLGDMNALKTALSALDELHAHTEESQKNRK